VPMPTFWITAVSRASTYAAAGLSISCWERT